MELNQMELNWVQLHGNRIEQLKMK